MDDLAQLTLHLANPSHAALWQQWRSEVTAQRYNPFAPHDESELAQRLKDCGSSLSDQSATHFRWFVQVGDQWVGHVAVTNISWSMGYGSIGYQIGESYAGRGYGTYAVGEMISRIFKESTLTRLQAYIHADNTPSHKLVLRLGFQHEGVLRQHVILNGIHRDQWIYGLLRQEWVE